MKTCSGKLWLANADRSFMSIKSGSSKSVEAMLALQFSTENQPTNQPTN
jgi:hypothetical protein